MDTFSFFSYVATRACKVTIRYVILKNNPFTTIKDPHYVEIIREDFAPAFQPFSQKAFQCDILHHYAIENKKLILYRKTHNYKVALISDIWSSRGRKSFLYIIFH